MGNLYRYLRQLGHIPLSMLILAILAFFTVSIFTYIPYIGFYFLPSGEVSFLHSPSNSLLQVGDRLLKVGDVSFEEYDKNSNQPLFTNDMKQGDVVPLTITRNGIEKQINWEIPGFTADEFRTRLFNIWWLAYVFWLFGAVIEAFIRPREIRWWLLLLSNHLTSLWLMLGSFSSWHLLGASILFHAVTWLMLPVYLHLNWIFPKPFRPLSKSFLYLLYGISLFLFLGELLQVLPQNLFGIAFIAVLFAIIILQIIHFIGQPEQRKQLRLLVFATLLASLPLITLIILSLSGGLQSNYLVAFLFFFFIPIIYLYLILRHQLGGLEVRANLFISIFAFLILIGTFLIIITRFTSFLPTETSALLTFVISLLSALVSIQFFPRFKSYIEKNVLGIKLDYQNLQEAYASRIITSTSVTSLLQLLEEEVFPSLFIRQFAFIQVHNQALKPLLMKNINEKQLPDDMQVLITKSGKYIPNLSANDDWLRLILPLKVGDSFLGFFLLGRRDPDDLYHQPEIPGLQSIANQTAIALNNILHEELLKQMYQSGVERYEQERLRLAHELHDSVLNELGDLRRNLGDNLSPSTEKSYKGVIDRLREIVSDLRPPMLTYGLAPAILALAENLMQQTGDIVKIRVDLKTTEERIPENIEVHLFRIIQEVLQNSLAHAKASNIKITGILSAQKADLFIEDDGIGFNTGNHLELSKILANHHFGLAGIMERAHIIGAKLSIESKLNSGTKIQIRWVAEKVN